MKGDYFLGTQDVTMTAQTSRAMFEHGLIGWLSQMSLKPIVGDRVKYIRSDRKKG